MKQIDSMKKTKRTIRRVLLVPGIIAILVLLCAVYALFIEPTWLCVRQVKLSSVPTVRVIHISDIHFAGDSRYLEQMVASINGITADFVCFTGDLVEDAAFLDDALRILGKINKPIYGVSGNHDRWALRSFGSISDVFRQTGGEWLERKSAMVASNRVAVITIASCQEQTPPDFKRILLEHYPGDIAGLSGVTFDLILAGHTHGRQVRIPLIGEYLVPFNIGKYDRGLFRTASGPMYVNPGIGTFYMQARFLCRPEITVIEI
ncbi:MAG: metallophosphoesterase [bacterium]